MHMRHPSSRTVTAAVLATLVLTPLAGCALVVGAVSLSSKVATSRTILDAALATARRFAETPAEMPLLTSGQAVEGTLTATDEQLEDGSHFHVWFYEGMAGERLIVRMTSEEFEPFVIIGFMEGGVQGEFVQLDGQGPLPDGSTARIGIDLEQTGLYAILANSSGPGGTGPYRLELAAVPSDQVPPAAEPGE
jgi:hypothetical protein